jgi:hypothetical protein
LNSVETGAAQNLRQVYLADLGENLYKIGDLKKNTIENSYISWKWVQEGQLFLRA